MAMGHQMLQHRHSIYAAKIDELIGPGDGSEEICRYYNILRKIRASPGSSAMLHFAAAKVAA
jgi:hypothetical protein